MRITCAPPAMPASSAIQPASRPMTSTTMMRWCDSAVVWILSTASVAVASAVSNPNVTSVAERSLSMVFGTPTSFIPRCNFLRAVTPDCDYGIDAQLARVGNNLIGNIAHNFFPVLDRTVAEGIAPVRGTEDCSATRQNAAHIFERELV